MKKRKTEIQRSLLIKKRAHIQFSVNWNNKIQKFSMKAVVIINLFVISVEVTGFIDSL